VQGEFTTGTVAASEAQIGLPSGLTIDSAKVPTLRLVGRFATASTSSSVVKNFGVLATGGDTFFNISQANYHSTQSPLSPQNGNSEISSSQKVSFFAEVPIEGWSSDATFLAAVPMNYTQTKILSADVNTNTTVSDLTFNNLVIGKVYQVTLNADFEIDGDLGLSVNYNHDGNVIAFNNMNNDAGGGTSRITNGVTSKPFVATDTTVTFTTTSASASEVLKGDGTLSSTHAYIIELNYTKETTRFE